MANEPSSFRVVDEKPPVILIDEATLRTAYDAGPVCQCEERYEAVKNLRLFIPGGTNPYERKVSADDDHLRVLWIRTSIEPRSLEFVKPVVLHKDDIPEKYHSPKQDTEELMFIKPPWMRNPRCGGGSGSGSTLPASSF